MYYSLTDSLIDRLRSPLQSDSKTDTHDVNMECSNAVIRGLPFGMYKGIAFKLEAPSVRDGHIMHMGKTLYDLRIRARSRSLAHAKDKLTAG